LNRHLIVPPLCSADEVNQILSGKLGLKYAGRNVEALKHVAKASRDRSLAEFNQVSMLQIIRFYTSD